MKNSIAKLGFCLFISALLLLAGLALVCCSFLWAPIADSQWDMVALIGGVVVVIAFTIISLVLCARINKLAPDKKDVETKSGKKQPKVQPSEEEEVSANKITYIPRTDVFNFVSMGSEQSVEEKFGQIALMDKTQFVIYIARLFSLKGYQVKLTTVLDNHNIDMIVEKRGSVIAVGCMHSDKVLCSEDIQCISDGLHYYDARQAMVITNTYFDRGALDYSKSANIKLVDRNVLAEDFF